MVKKIKNKISMVVLSVLMIVMVGYSSSSSGNKFLGKWQNTSDSKIIMTIEYLNSKHKVLKISDTDQTLTGTLEDGIIKLDSIAKVLFEPVAMPSFLWNYIRFLSELGQQL